MLAGVEACFEIRIGRPDREVDDDVDVAGGEEPSTVSARMPNSFARAAAAAGLMSAQARMVMPRKHWRQREVSLRDVAAADDANSKSLCHMTDPKKP